MLPRTPSKAWWRPTIDEGFSSSQPRICEVLGNAHLGADDLAGAVNPFRAWATLLVGIGLRWVRGIAARAPE